MIVLEGSIIVLQIQPLSSGEIEVLKKLIEINRDVNLLELAKMLNRDVSSISPLVELLRSKGIVDVNEIEKIFAKTSEEGIRYINGLPEEIITIFIRDSGGAIPIEHIENTFGKEFTAIGIGWARRRGWVSIENGTAKYIRYTSLDKHRKYLKIFSELSEISMDIYNDSVFQELVKRKLIIVEKRKIKIVKLVIGVEEARNLIEQGTIISRLSRDVIVSGMWRKAVLKPYNVEAKPPVVYPGKKHFFKEFIDMIREIMERLGFVEVRDDYVIPELWNFDILFQAQDHPSRDIHDILVVDGFADLDRFRDIVERTRNVHEFGGSCGSIGWRYSWSLEKASRLILRSHTTAITARFLSIYREPPVRLYAISRVFRRDNPDARHSPEFTNFDGVIMERDFSFRKLLGLLSQILRYMGIEKYRFKPAYFPFTEPSVEGYGYVSGYGWIEVFGAGMFRPEVLEILGVNSPVGAWGMGVERLAMVVYGIDDIRLLFSKDIEFIRRFPLYRMRLLQ